MPRHRNPRKGNGPPEPGPQTSEGLQRPFRNLAALVKQQRLPLSCKPSPPRLRGSKEEHLLFQEAMYQVQPLPQEGAYVVPPRARPGPPRSPENEELEALTRLTELVAGQGDFDLSLTDEYLEGRVAALNPQIMLALKAGAFPVQDYLDLHGLTVAQARECLEQFLAHSRARGYRTVLVIHGRGHRSPNHIPVLKTHLQSWLTWKRFRRQVLAFATAQPHDGGAGALYLLLRRSHE